MRPMVKPFLVCGIQTSSHQNSRNGIWSTVAVLSAVCFLGYPTGAAAEFSLEYAVFDLQEETLYLEFDALPAYGNLTLRPDGAGSFLAYDIGTERRNVLDLDAEALEQFRSMSCPTLHVGAGSFVNADGAPIGNHSVPLWVVPQDGWTPPRPGVDVSCILTYRIIESPLTPSDNLLGAVRDGLEAWSELNPGLKFRHIEAARANISIEFGKNGALGQACSDCLYTFATKQVIQRCSGEPESPSQGAVILLNRKVSDYNTLRDTVAHEFGHNLGLCHHHYADNVMGKGARDDIQILYDDFGYSIPETLESGRLTAIAIVATVLLSVASIAVVVWQRARRTEAYRQRGQFQ